MSDDIRVAIIAGIVSLVVAIFGYFTGRNLEWLRDKIQERQAERAVRRDYEYEARKRLYQEFQPLVFQLVELSENALYRIFSLARSAREGDIKEDGTGWLSTDSYYISSTLYYLLAPVVILKLMQRRLTLVDISVEPTIKAYYLLVKGLYLAHTDDFDLANLKRKDDEDSKDYNLEYDPFVRDWETKRKTNPAKYWRQALPLGLLDRAVEALITHDPDNSPRIISFGEFQTGFETENSKIQQEFFLLADIFRGFHPKTRPILWRILYVQACMCNTLKQTGSIALVAKNDNAQSAVKIVPLSEKDREELKWYQEGETTEDLSKLLAISKVYFNDPRRPFVWEDI